MIMYEAPIVKKAFQILQLIARQDKRMTISDLSRELGIGKSTVHGILHALRKAGAVARDDRTRCYSLGLALFELGRKAYGRIDLKDIARPFMEDLMRTTRQSVFLGIRADDHVLILDLVESTQDLKITAPIGAKLPLLIGAVGKIFIAGMEDGEAAQFVRSASLRRDTDRSITNPECYLDETRRAREAGYALDDGEYIQGVRAVAAPVRAPGSQPSAIWVVGFTQSMADASMPVIAMETKCAADAISRKAGLRPAEREGP